jgi:hypothetical protein
MNTSITSSVTATVAMAAMATLLTACNSNPTRATACSLPQGPDLNRAIAAARFDLETGCEQQFDQYFQRLLTIAEGDPKKDNKSAFSDFRLILMSGSLANHFRFGICFHRLVPY